MRKLNLSETILVSGALSVAYNHHDMYLTLQAGESFSWSHHKSHSTNMISIHFTAYGMTVWGDEAFNGQYYSAFSSQFVSGGGYGFTITKSITANNVNYIIHKN